jgi:hypothetical protein
MQRDAGLIEEGQQVIGEHDGEDEFAADLALIGAATKAGTLSNLRLRRIT